MFLFIGSAILPPGIFCVKEIILQKHSALCTKICIPAMHFIFFNLEKWPIYILLYLFYKKNFNPKYTSGEIFKIYENL